MQLTYSCTSKLIFYFVSLVSLVDHFSAQAPQKVVLAIGILREAGNGIGDQKTQTAKDRVAVEGIDGMTQDESDGGRR